MKNQGVTLNRLNSLLWVLFGLFMLSKAGAAELVFYPDTPSVEIGKQITLSVSGTSGAVTWNPIKGQIQGAGNQVTYIAPAQAGLDVVTAFDSDGNVGVVKITVTSKQMTSLENANWEVFTNRNKIQALALSKDKAILWVGTRGGLEQRNASSGKLDRVYINTDALPDNDIRSLFSDDEGGVWIGTVRGLAHLKHDGSWQIFNIDNSNLPYNNVLALLSDNQGGMWVGTWGGLAHLKTDGSWQVFNTDNSNLPSNQVKTLLSDEQGGIWVGTDSDLESAHNGGLAHFKADGSWQVFNTDNSNIPSNNIETLLSDEQGGIWVGTVFDTVFDTTKPHNGGLAHFKADGSWQVFNTDNSNLPDNYVWALLSDNQGGVWTGTRLGLAHLKADGSWQIFNTDNSNLSDKDVRALISDNRGGIWVGTEYSSIAYLKADGSWQVFKDNLNLPENSIRALISDEKDGIYVGTLNRGFAHLKADSSWQVFNTDNSNLPNNHVEALLSDAQGGIWVGISGDGLAHLKNDGSWQVFNTDNSNLPNNSISVLLSDKQGGIWVGTWNGGLAHLKNDDSWQVFNTDNSILPSNNVMALLLDKQGGIWIGTYSDGLAHLKNDGSWQVFNTDNSNLPSNNIKVLISDEQGGIWIGTYRDGLVHFKKDGFWQVFNTDNSNLPSNEVKALISDEQGGIWIGTYIGGLIHLNSDGYWQVFNKDNSNLPSNFVYALLSDEQGGVWIGAGGLAHLTFTQKNTLCTDLNDTECQNVLTDKRAAILIHPRGQGTGYNQAVSIEFMATHAYRTLQNRGYDNDEIYFLSYKPDVDINGDGFVDRNVVDGPITAFDLAAGSSPRDLTRADVQQAFDWAKQKGQLDQPLLVIFVDHALPGKLRLDPFDEVLTAQDLGTMLTDYQQTTGSQAVVVLEACHTGSLMSGLAGFDRLIVTSTAEDLAYYDNLGMFSFSKFFFDNLRRGESFFDAFQTVSSKLPTYGHPFDLQIPQLDDDGDGLNTSNDGRLARKWCLNGCFGALSGEITLEPETPAATVTAGQTIPLVVRAGITEGRIKGIWALIMTPDAAKQRNEQGFSLIPTPVVNLSQQPEDASRWQGAFSGFQYRGDYVVTFMAEDNEGFITAAVPVVLTLPEGSEVPDIETEIEIYPAPTPNQTLYHDGDTLRVTLPPLPAEQVQYVGRSLPDGTLFLLSNLNGFVTLDAANIPVFQGGDVAIEAPITAEMPSGEYILYLLRIPVGVDLLTHPELWMVGVSSFKVE